MTYKKLSLPRLRQPRPDTSRLPGLSEDRGQLTRTQWVGFRLTKIRAAMDAEASMAAKMVAPVPGPTASMRNPVATEMSRAGMCIADAGNGFASARKVPGTCVPMRVSPPSCPSPCPAPARAADMTSKLPWLDN